MGMSKEEWVLEGERALPKEMHHTVALLRLYQSNSLLGTGIKAER